MRLKIAAIVAMDESRLIGASGKIPWKISDDMRRFSNLTTGHTVMMGRKTYQSLPAKFRPLPGRRNMVITRNPETLAGENGIEIFESVNECLSFCETASDLPSRELWIIGGAEIYAQTFSACDVIELTLVYGKHEGDTWLPPFEEQFDIAERVERETHSFITYVRKSKPLQ